MICIPDFHSIRYLECHECEQMKWCQMSKELWPLQWDISLSNMAGFEFPKSLWPSSTHINICTRSMNKMPRCLFSSSDNHHRKNATEKRWEIFSILKLSWCKNFFISYLSLKHTKIKRKKNENSEMKEHVDTPTHKWYGWVIEQV